MKYFLISVGLFLYSCGSNPQERLENPLNTIGEEDILLVNEPENTEIIEENLLKPEKVDQSIIDNVKFSFKIVKVKNRMYDYELKASIENQNKDTVYFLCMSCFGESDLIEFDKRFFEIDNYINCSASNPSKYKIAPNSKHKFNTTLKIKKNIKKVKLGFDFFAVKKDFVLEIGNPINISERLKENKTIIWAKEKILPRK